MLVPVTQTLDQTGTYAIHVQDLDNNQTVEYTLALDRVAPPSPNARPIDYGETPGDEINGIGDIDLFFFHGAAGGRAPPRTRISCKEGGKLTLLIFLASAAVPRYLAQILCRELHEPIEVSPKCRRPALVTL